MTIAQKFLDSSRRQIIRLIALGLGALGLTFVVLVAAMLVVESNPGLIIFLIALLLFLFGAGTTLATLGRWPLSDRCYPSSSGCS